MNVCDVNAALLFSIIAIQQYKLILKLHVNGLESMQSDIISVSSGT